MKMKLSELLILFLLSLIIYFQLRDKKEVNNITIHNEFRYKKDSIINAYSNEKDSINKKVDNITFDSSYNELIKWLQSRQ